MDDRLARRWALLLLCIACATGANAAASAPDCPPAQPMASPARPADLDPSAGGTVVLLLDLDACGAVAKSTVETGSGHAALDDAAKAAASGWVFRGDFPSRIRVPVAFASGADAGAHAPSVQDEYTRMRFPGQKPGSDGKLPGTIFDIVPPEATTVAGVVEWLDREASRQPEQDRIRPYEKRGVIAWSTYEVFDDPGWPWAPALVRRRLVFDDRHAFWATTVMCEASAADCATFATFVAGDDAPRQALRPAPPAPPAR